MSDTRSVVWHRPRVPHALRFVSLLLLAACSDPSSRQPDVEESPAAVVTAENRFVGSDACRQCHEAAFNAWRGSHHDRAMEQPDEASVLGDFDAATFEYHGRTTRFDRRADEFVVTTTGRDGRMHAYPVTYTFGVAPLQQYLVEYPGGRMQALPYAWDTRPAADGGQRWFHLYPDADVGPGDRLHWTGRDQNWNYMCAECHSTDLKIGYDPASDSFSTTYEEIDVGCESCHGPGSRHVDKANAGDLATDTGLVVDLDDRGGSRWQIDPDTGIAVLAGQPPRDHQLQPEACGRCHARRGILTDDYGYGRPLADTHRPALIEEPLYFADGQIRDEVYVYGSFLQSRMYRAGVTCSDCHEPHSNALITGPEPDTVCSRCHSPARFAATEHHRHAPGTVGCVDCHMTDRTYMLVDDRRDHSFRVPRPDLTEALGVPNACADCHADQDAAWSAAAFADWYPRAHLEPESATALHAGRRMHANDALAGIVASSDFSDIIRATALATMRNPVRPEHVALLRDALAETDPLVRMAALRTIATLPQDVTAGFDGIGLLDDVRAVRLEAVLAYAGIRDLLPVPEARAFGAAEREYRDSLDLIAMRPEAHASRAGLELALGNPQRAIEHYRRAVDMDPTLVSARVNLADVLRSLGDDVAAEQVLRDGLDATQDVAPIRHVLGLTLVRTGRRDAALEQLELAALASPDNARFQYVYAVALNSTGRKGEALEVLEAAWRRFPTDLDIGWALATMSRDAADPERALDVATQLAGRYPWMENLAALRDGLANGQ